MAHRKPRIAGVVEIAFLGAGRFGIFFRIIHVHLQGISRKIQMRFTGETSANMLVRKISHFRDEKALDTVL
jgi:hypothetical protein